MKCCHLHYFCLHFNINLSPCRPLSSAWCVWQTLPLVVLPFAVLPPPFHHEPLTLQDALECMVLMADAAANILKGDHSAEAHTKLRGLVSKLEQSRLKVRVCWGGKNSHTR